MLAVGLLFGFRSHARATQSLAKLLVPWIVEPIVNALRHRQADFVNAVQFLHGGLAQPIQRPEVARQNSSGAFANVPYAQAVD